jgi:hypothetical protein
VENAEALFFDFHKLGMYNEASDVTTPTGRILLKTANMLATTPHTYIFSIINRG